MFDMNRIRHLNTDLVCKTIPSPVGPLTLIASDDALLSVNFKKSKWKGENEDDVLGSLFERTRVSIFGRDA